MKNEKRKFVTFRSKPTGHWLNGWIFLKVRKLGGGIEYVAYCDEKRRMIRNDKKRKVFEYARLFMEVK